MTTATTTPLYLVAEHLAVHDREKLLQYANQVKPVLERFGGRILATFPPPTTIEGDWQPVILTIQRWPSADDFHAFWSSPDYAPLRELRQEASETQIVTLAGVPEPDPPSPIDDHDNGAGDLESIREAVANAQRHQSALEPMLALHTEDTVIVNVAGRRVIGRDGFRQAMQHALVSPPADVATTIDLDDVRFVAGNVAIVSCTQHVHSNRDTRDGALHRAGALTYVVVKDGDGWKIALAQTTPTSS